MKQLKALGFILLTLVITLFITTYFHNQRILALQLEKLENSVDEVQRQNITLGTGIYAVTTQLAEIKLEIKREPVDTTETEAVSRGSSNKEPAIMRVTAYDLSYASCKKYPEHPQYGITASGVRVKEWHTIAAGPELPFNTKIFIPYFEDKPNKGIFTVEDRGSAITKNCLDIYMESGAACGEFGAKQLEIYILEGGM